MGVHAMFASLILCKCESFHIHICRYSFVLVHMVSSTGDGDDELFFFSRSILHHVYAKEGKRTNCMSV